MKERIYTIPLNEAFDENSECPFCSLFSTLEDHKTDYFLGAAMMEPDVRIVTNVKGFCHHHLHQMLQKQHTLSLALSLDTHLMQIQKRLASHQKEIDDLSQEKGWFKKGNALADAYHHLEDTITQTNQTCAVCDEIKETMDRYYETFFYLYTSEKDFAQKVENSKGFCLPHFSELLSRSQSLLSSKQQKTFLKMLYLLETNHLARLQDEIHYYTEKFDYRNQNADWKNSKDAPQRTVEKLVGR